MIGQNVSQNLTQITLQPMADITSTTTGTGVNVQEYVGEAVFLVAAKNVAGTNPTLDVKLQESDDDSTYTDVTGGAFTQVTEAGTKAAKQYKLNINIDGAKKYIRTVATIGGTSSPQFLVYATGLLLKKER